MRLRLDVAVNLAEEHVVRTDFAHFQRVMAIRGITAADDQLRREFFDSLGEISRIAGDVQAIRLGPARDPRIACNQRGGTRFLNDRDQGFGMFLERVIAQAILRNDDGCYITATQRAGQDPRAALDIGNIRRDEDQAAAIVLIAHNVSVSDEMRVRAYHPYSISIRKSDRPCGQKDQPIPMLPDFHFYAIAIPAVLLVGFSKGGMGEALSMMGVPILSLVVSPVQAAALLLPILIAMDAVALWTWRHNGDRKTLTILLPGALVGIGIGWATSAYVSRDVLRLIIGLITVLFVLRYAYNTWRARQGIVIPAKPHRTVPAMFFGSFAGYGSFVAHSGGPPFQIYALPLKLPPRDYTGTMVRFFAILNAVKLIPYFALGQLDTSNLATSVTLFPLAMLATMAGAWVVKRMQPQVFYPFMYTMAFLAGMKLVYDGTVALATAY